MSDDICERLVRFSKHKQCMSTDLEVEAAAEITRLREEIARHKHSYQQYIEAADRMNGTPCEQIRHKYQVEALREENARLREALEPIVKIKAFTCIYEWTPVEALRDDEEVHVKLTGSQIKKMRAAIREGGKDE